MWQHVFKTYLSTTTNNAFRLTKINLNIIIRKMGIVKGGAPVAEKAETEKKAVQPAAKPAPVEKVEKAPKATSQAKVAPVKRTQHKG